MCAPVSCGEGGHVRAMHRAAVARVCAHAQAEALTRIEGALTERERDVGPPRPQRPSDTAEKRRCRRIPSGYGIGGWIGYLFVTGQAGRMEEILGLALEDEHEER